MPVKWDDSLDKKLLFSILTTNNKITLKFDVVAKQLSEATGDEYDARAVKNRFYKLRYLAQTQMRVTKSEDGTAKSEKVGGKGKGALRKTCGDKGKRVGPPQSKKRKVESSVEDRDKENADTDEKEEAPYNVDDMYGEF